MSRNTYWTEAEKKILAEKFPTHTTKHIAELLGRGEREVYAATRRYGIKKIKPVGGSLTAQILEACTDSKGKCLGELKAVTGGHGNSITNIAICLTKEGRLFKAGIARHYRFFVNEADAKAWDVLAPAAYAEHCAKAAQAQSDFYRNRYKNSKAMQATVPREVNPHRKPRTEQKPKVQIAPKAAKVVWPEHVAVQVIPTPPPRFAFTPPAGWRGEISKDWINRRLGNLTIGG